MEDVQELHISQNSRKQLYDSLKNIYGPGFILSDSLDDENNNSEMSKEKKDAYIKTLVAYSKKINEPKTEEQIAEQLETQECQRKRDEEKRSLKFIYGDNFTELGKNKWSIKLFLECLKNEEDVQNGEESKTSDKNICHSCLQENCNFGSKCRYSYKKTNSKKDPYVNLEITFPDGCQYPSKPPYFDFQKNDSFKLTSLECLKISQILYIKAQKLSNDKKLSIFAIISFLEDKEQMKRFLNNQCLENNDALFEEFYNMLQNADSKKKDKEDTVKLSKNKISSEDFIKKNKEIKSKLQNKRSESKNDTIKKHRENLPTWGLQDEILKTINENQVTIISGVTGCGKSTQVPQFILDDWVNNMTTESNKLFEIISTQPRRISAISLADRVAVERNEELGDIVGYKISMENKISTNTRLTFCTTGILLQKLIGDPSLESVSHIIVDEVHERTADCDFLLMILKKLIIKRPDLKIVLMSATLDTDEFSSYFSKVQVINIPGKQFSVKQLFLEDILEILNYDFVSNLKSIKKGGKKINLSNINHELLLASLNVKYTPLTANTVPDEELGLPQLTARYSKYSMLTCKNLYLMDYSEVDYILLNKVIEWIFAGEHNYPKTGSILVFLPGLLEIRTLHNCLKNNGLLSSARILELHSSFSAEEQSLIFEETKPGERKIILSTNIAETSITIDDCIFVIDSGKINENKFLPDLNIEKLETCWVSQTNAIQRKGRAGRVMPGVCIHLYSSFRFRYKFRLHQTPEILRISLESIILRSHVLNKGHNFDIYDVLGSMLDSPDKFSVSCAMKRLQDVGALNSKSELTPLGHNLARLPVDVRVGKLILFGAIFCCLDSALTIAAFLTHKSPFSNSLDLKDYVTKKKKRIWYRHF